MFVYSDHDSYLFQYDCLRLCRDYPCDWKDNRADPGSSWVPYSCSWWHHEWLQLHWFALFSLLNIWNVIINFYNSIYIIRMGWSYTEEDWEELKCNSHKNPNQVYFGGILFVFFLWTKSEACLRCTWSVSEHTLVIVVNLAVKIIYLNLKANICFNSNYFLLKI